MPNQKKQKNRPASPEVQSPTPQRSQTVRRRISSGFVSFLSNLPLRRSTPQQDPYNRPRTAPNPDRVVVRRANRAPDSQQAPMPHIRIPMISEPEQPCPYDSTNYPSFPSIKRSRCDFCGRRPPSKSKPDEPCNDCRSKGPFSHLRFGHRRKLGPEPKEDIPAESFTPGSQHSPSSSDDMIRIVPPHIAAKRIGNPPRTASLPAGISRLGAPNTLPRPSAPSASKPPVQTPAIKGTGTVKHQRSDIENNSEVRPTSPKLHYIRGLPNSKAYPYVRKQEVKQHIAAMHAGSPSPLVDLARAAHARTANLDWSKDFTETVFYGREDRVGFTVGGDTGGRVSRPRAHQPGNIDMVELEAGRILVKRPSREVPGSTGERLGRGEVQRRQSPEQRAQQSRSQRPPSTASDRSRSSNSNPNANKLRDGSEQDCIPRLRGGSGGDEQRSCSFLLKQLLLTCHRPNHGTPSSDDDLPPPRTPNPAEVARAIRRASGTARLPRNISRHSPIAVKISPSNVKSRTASFAAAHAKRHSILSHLPHCPFAHRPADSPINIPFPSKTSKPATQPQISKPTNRPQRFTSANLSPKTSFTPPVVSLRGGAGSPSILRDHERLPAGLFWLAGGTRRPITAASWKAQRGKKRMGGLVGMAVHGLKAGTAYRNDEKDAKEGKEKEASTAKPASVAGSLKDTEKGGKGVAEDKAESVKSSRTQSSKSSSSSKPSKSSTKSHGSRSSKSSSSSSKSSKSSADVAKEGEEQRDASLDPVPEEPAGEAAREGPAEEAAAPAPQVEAAAEDLPVEGAAAADNDTPAEAPANVESVTAADKWSAER